MPRRGLISILGTVLGLLLVIGFRTADQMTPALPAGGLATLNAAGLGPVAAAGGSPAPDTANGLVVTLPCPTPADTAPAATPSPSPTPIPLPSLTPPRGGEDDGGDDDGPRLPLGGPVPTLAPTPSPSPTPAVIATPTPAPGSCIPAGGGTTAQATPTPGSGQGVTGTFTGPAVRNPYGQVKIQVTVQNGRITDVTALSLPQGGYSGRVSSYAAPILRIEALNAQGANINAVSGATYTSQAYAQSLQGALDAAHI